MVVWMELPGMKKEQVEVHVNESVQIGESGGSPLPSTTTLMKAVSSHSDKLTISGRKKYHGGMSAEDDEDKTICLKNEREWGAFYREIPIPRGMEEGQVKAEMENGLLKVVIPKIGKRESASIPCK